MNLNTDISQLSEVSKDEVNLNAIAELSTALAGLSYDVSFSDMPIDQSAAYIQENVSTCLAHMVTGNIISTFDVECFTEGDNFILVDVSMAVPTSPEEISITATIEC